MSIALQAVASLEESEAGKSVLIDKESSKVMVVLESKDFEKCCLELIRHQISFEVKYHSRPVPSFKDKESSFYDAPSDNFTELVKEIYNKYLNGNFKNVPPNEQEIAKEHGIKLMSFKRLFKKIYGQPFYQLYLERRMEYAAQLLQKGYKANEVAAMIGYSASSAIKFNKMFQKRFQMTPKKYQLHYFGKINRR